MDLRDILKNLKVDTTLTAPPEKEYLQLPRQLVLLEYLSNNPYDPERPIHNIYQPAIYPVDAESIASLCVVLHGHEYIVPCYASGFCHELGYRPTGAEHPNFLKLWKLKWNL